MVSVLSLYIGDAHPQKIRCLNLSLLLWALLLSLCLCCAYPMLCLSLFGSRWLYCCPCACSCAVLLCACPYSALAVFIAVPVPVCVGFRFMSAFYLCSYCRYYAFGLSLFSAFKMAWGVASRHQTGQSLHKSNRALFCPSRFRRGSALLGVGVALPVPVPVLLLGVCAVYTGR